MNYKDFKVLKQLTVNNGKSKYIVFDILYVFILMHRQQQDYDTRSSQLFE